MLDLIGQLLLIGSTEPIVMIAGIVILSCIVLAVASISCAAIISIPIGIGHFIIKLIVTVVRLVTHRDYEEYEGDDVGGDYDESAEEERCSPEDESVEDEDSAEPRYPDWMNQKSGRLL